MVESRIKLRKTVVYNLNHCLCQFDKANNQTFKLYPTTGVIGISQIFPYPDSSNLSFIKAITLPKEFATDFLPEKDKVTNVRLLTF